MNQKTTMDFIENQDWLVDNPATEPQPKFDVRINNGQIEVKLAEN